MLPVGRRARLHRVRRQASVGCSILSLTAVIVDIVVIIVIVAILDLISIASAADLPAVPHRQESRKTMKNAGLGNDAQAQKSNSQSFHLHDGDGGGMQWCQRQNEGSNTTSV